MSRDRSNDEELSDPPELGDARAPAPESRDSASREMRDSAEQDIARVLVTERILLSALREQDAADAADLARRRAEFLAEASLRFGVSLDQELTYAAIASLELPGLEAWCVVDVVEAGGTLRRIAAVHAHDDHRVATRALATQWFPTADDAIGVPAVAQARVSVVISEDAGTALCTGVRDPAIRRTLEGLNAGSLLVVPVIAHDLLLGAITFVTRVGAPAYTAEDIRFGEALAGRCAQALESARLYAAARAAVAEADAARAEAEAANRAKSDFLAVMSHELRTPLNAIGGYAALIEMGIHGPVTPEQAAALARIQQSQRSLLGLINGVLNFSRLEAGAVSYVVQPVALGEALAACGALIAPQARATGISVDFKPCDSELAARADPEKLQQVLLNLLGNAIKFTGSGGAIAVSCASRDNGTVDLYVSDTGCGIAPEELERVFHPFVQLDATLTRTREGTGLGLAISRDLVRGMGGDLTVESTLGAGSTFTVTLPAVHSVSPPASPSD
ncbi:MAG: hypothetical protein H0W68_03450 [Gemmatimonadaceae bacterium]|nr:hypothetical protein [Gemmatimonadaceae bacterium]